MILTFRTAFLRNLFILFYFILFYFILFYFILFYFILFYFILFYFYFILFYFILFYFILFLDDISNRSNISSVSILGHLYYSHHAYFHHTILLCGHRPFAASSSCMFLLSYSSHRRTCERGCRATTETSGSLRLFAHTKSAAQMK